MERVNAVKKKTRTVKQTIIIYVIGTILCIYFGFLCGASWMSGDNFSEFIIRFNDFVIVNHHFLVGVTEATLPFVASYWVLFSLIFIIIMTQFEHPFAGQEYGVAKWGDAISFSKEFAAEDTKENVVEVNPGSDSINGVLKVNTKNYWLAENVYLSIDNVKTSNLNILVVGPPGSGKSFRLARPMLSQLCGNFLVTDPNSCRFFA